MPFDDVTRGASAAVAAAMNKSHKRLDTQGQSALAIQNQIRKKLMANMRLHRFNLAERLMFESKVLAESARFINQTLIFAFLLISLRYSSKEVEKRSIYDNLNGAFDFEALEDYADRQDFVESGLPMISEACKSYFLRSSIYFDDGGGGGTIILREATMFTGPKFSGQLALNGAEFSFTAWVKTGNSFVTGNILRKGLANSGPGSEALSCWSWNLHVTFGQRLHFGGHDYFPTPDSFPPSQSVKRQEEIGPASTPFQAGKWAFLTVTVSGTTATFFHDLTQIGSVTLQKPLSDCLNPSGIQVGGSGMQLGDVRYHRSALILADIEELTSAGGSLADLSTGSEPQEFSTTEIEKLDGSVNSNFNTLASNNRNLNVMNQANFVLQLAQPTDPSTYQSAAAKVGKVDVNTTVLSDGTRSFIRLAKGPERLTETRAADDHRYLMQWPSFAGRGATLSMWYRHNEPCIEPTDPCGMYLLDARDGATPCWGFWLQSNPLLFWVNTPGNSDSGFLDTVPGMDEKYTFQTDKAWRHVALVLDETDNTAKVYLDGTLAAQRAWGSAVDQADCSTPEKKLAYGRATPGYTYGAEVEVFDFRLYDHGTTGPLTPAHIRTLAQDAVAKATLGGEANTCLTIDNLRMQEKEWADKFGHTCSWYAENFQAFPGLCDYPGAAENCPSACKSTQECWLDAQPSKAYYTWDSIQRIDPGENAPNGTTLCLGDALDSATIVAECESWVEGGGAASTAAFAKWATSYEAAKGQRLDLRQCAAVEQAILEGCAFNSEAVKQFTAASQANNGDFSIAFWVRPLTQASLQPDTARFIPHLQFLSSFSPPTHNMAWGLWENPNGEVRLFSECDQMENIEMKAASDSGWTFIAITKKNSRSGVAPDATVVTNLGTNFEGSAWTAPQCLFDAENFFQALEVNYPVAISPIMMVPEAVPVALLQQQYLSDRSSMEVKDGPSGTADDLASIEVEKEDFTKASVLVAPPIIFQTRAMPASECSNSFAQQFIKDQNESMTSEQCAAPFDCEADLLQDPAQLLACTGDSMTEEKHVGLDPVNFKGTGYADFLFSITESIFLARDGVIHNAGDFIDRMTTEAQIILVFFTPRVGTTTVLTVDAGFDTSAAIEVDVRVEHYEIVEDGDLTAFMIIQIMIFFPVAFMTIDVCIHFRQTAKAVIEQKKADMEAQRLADTKRRQAREGVKTGVAEMAVGMGFKVVFGLVTDVIKALRMLFLDLIDLAIAGLVIVYVALRMPAVTDSADDALRVVGKLGNIEWTSRDLSLSQKTSQFLESISEINDLLAWQVILDRLCTFVLLLSLLRLLKCTSMHPRLALLEGTLVKAWDDLWHSAILILLLMTCFAGIATWSFGSERPDFADFETSLQKLFEMTFGEFPDDWTESFELRLFTVLYFMIVFLLVQNFLLAVIVEAYMGVRKDNEELKTEQEFIMDISSSMYSHYLAARKGWPMPWKLGPLLEDWIARRSIGYQDLLRTGMFRNKEAVSSFIKYYRKFDFLEPEPFNEYGPVITNDQARMVHELELRLAKQQGVRLPTLKEFAHENLKIAADRKGKPRPRKAPNGTTPNGNGVNGNGMNSNGMNGNGNGNGFSGNGQGGVYKEGGFGGGGFSVNRSLTPVPPLPGTIPREGSISATSDVAFFLAPNQRTSVQPTYPPYGMPGSDMGSMPGVRMPGVWGGRY